MKSLTVAVLGCGVIGQSWIRALVLAGHRVRCWDVEPAVERAVAQLTASQKEADVRFFSDPTQAVYGADFVQENCPENLALKQTLYRQIECAIDAGAVLASSTSTLQATQLQQDIGFAERIVIGHPFNPPHLLPLVEVVGGEQTSEHSIQQAMDFYRDLGKQAIHLKTERPGHLANRLQAAVWREAIDAVASGQASVQKTIKNRVYTSTAEYAPKGKMDVSNRFERPGERFSYALKANSSAHLASSYQQFAKEDHGSVGLPSLYNGLKFIFEGYKILPPRVESQGLEAVKTYYKKYLGEYGMALQPPKSVVSELAFLAELNGNDERAIEYHHFIGVTGAKSYSLNHSLIAKHLDLIRVANNTNMIHQTILGIGE